MYYVYILRSLINGKLYTGSTENIQRRFEEHNTSRSNATKHGRPFELIYQEVYDSRSQAYQREMYLKTGKGREKLKNIMGM